MTAPVSLAGFLAARLDEDEAAANAVYGFWRAYGDRAIADDSYVAILIDDVDPDTRSHILRHDPARVLREVAANRAILTAFEGWSAAESPDYWPGLDLALRHLAAVYSDHPDYRDEWKP